MDAKTQQLMHTDVLLPWILDNGLNLVAAVVILLVGIWLAGKVAYLVLRALDRLPHFDQMLKGFFASLARYAVLTVTVLAVLSRFGIQTTSLIAVLGAAGLAVGLALQGTLSNLAAGVMLLIFRPFKVGQVVNVAGNAGTVKDLSLFWTEIVTDDHIQIIVPNGSVWGTALKNFSTYAPPPVPGFAGEVRQRVPETADLAAAAAKLQAIATSHAKVAKDPAPMVLFDRAADGALEIVVKFTATEDAVASVRSDIIRAAQGLGA